MGLATIRVSPKNIEALLSSGHIDLGEHRPTSAKVCRFWIDHKAAPHGELEILLEHDDLFSVPDGSEIPRIKATFRKETVTRHIRRNSTELCEA